MRTILSITIITTMMLALSCKKEISISEKQSESYIKFFGTPYTNYGYSISKLSDGGFVISGSITKDDQGRAADADLVLIRTDKYGNEVWPSKLFGGRFADAGYSVCLASDGGYTIAGSYGDSTSQGYTTDLYLVHTNADGDSLWTRQFGGAYNEAGYCIRKTSDDGYIIAGFKDSTGRGKEIWLVKTDVNGTLEWEKSAGFEYDETASQVFEYAGGYIVCGTSKSYDKYQGIESGIIMKAGPTGNAFNPIYICSGEPVTDGTISMLADGSIFFAGTQTNTSNFSRIVIARFDANLNAVALANTSLNLPKSSSVKDIKVVGDGIVYTGTNLESSDILLVKSDFEGNVVFSNSFGETGSQQGESIVQSGDGGFAIAGFNRYETSNVQITLLKTRSDGNQ